MARDVWWLASFDQFNGWTAWAWSELVFCQTFTVNAIPNRLCKIKLLYLHKVTTIDLKLTRTSSLEVTSGHGIWGPSFLSHFRWSVPLYRRILQIFSHHSSRPERDRNWETSWVYDVKEGRHWTRGLIDWKTQNFKPEKSDNRSMFDKG